MMAGMVARPVTAVDVATIRYFKHVAEEQERGVSWLSRKAGIPYPTLKTYWDTESRALTMGDIDQLMRVLHVDPGKAVKEIRRLATAIQQADS